jgi:hypothetical protein
MTETRTFNPHIDQIKSQRAGPRLDVTVVSNINSIKQLTKRKRMYNSTKKRFNPSSSRSIMKNVEGIARPVLSNRCSYCSSYVFPIPTIPSDVSIGVDRIAVEIPLVPSKSDAISLLSTIKNTLLGRWGTKAKAVHAASGADIHFSYSKARSSIVMEFNPSRFMDPDGTGLVPVEAVARITELLIEEHFKDGEALPTFALTAEGEESLEYWEENWQEQIRIIRLDVARDFLIIDPYFNLDLYKETKAKFARAVSILYNDGKAETWDSPNSKKSGHVKFYNKHRQALKKQIKDLPAEGTFRFEYMLRNKHLQRAHIHTLKDLTPAKFELALRQGWEISKLDTPVSHPQGWVNQILDSELDPILKIQMIGLLHAENNGFEAGLRQFQINSLKQAARSIGITFRKPLAKQGNIQFTLDLDSGTARTDKFLNVCTDSESIA